LNWEKEKVFVTGADGFIGSHLAEELVMQGARVTALVYYNSWSTYGWLDRVRRDIVDAMEIVVGDIRDAESIEPLLRHVDTVFHLAALISIPYSYKAGESFVETNIKGTLNVLNAARKGKVKKILHTSTSEVYGSARYVPMDESHPLQPQSPYAASKVGADMMALSYYLSFDLPVTIVRPFNAFGPRQTPRCVIPTIILQCLKNRETGKPIRLGNLDTRRDLTYVKDTVSGFLRIAEADKTDGEVLNIGVGKDFAIREVADIIFRLLGVDLPVEQEQQRLRPEKSEVERLCCDNRKIVRMCGWKPTYSLDEGLRLTIAWLEENLHLFDADIYSI
jgi:NAD dependent epimerase/dehydratase